METFKFTDTQSDTRFYTFLSKQDTAQKSKSASEAVGGKTRRYFIILLFGDLSESNILALWGSKIA